jgi:hypothetical protein
MKQATREGANMAEETGSQAIDAGNNQLAPEAGGAAQIGARGLLRDAIHKVMEEIEHHEREAKHHLEQAAQLRKALRESISFLHEEGEKKASVSIPKGLRTDKAGAADDKEKHGAASTKHQRGKKK